MVQNKKISIKLSKKDKQDLIFNELQNDRYLKKYPDVPDVVAPIIRKIFPKLINKDLITI